MDVLRLVVSPDGSLAAIGEPGKVTILGLPNGAQLSEIGLDVSADGYELAWLGGRLLVVSRFTSHTTVHLLEPRGPELVAEIRMSSAVALYAAVGPHALVVGAQGAAIITAGDAHLTPYQFPARARPTIAGAAANQFVVALSGVIEEWDPTARVPKRRLRLPRPTNLAAVGGSERVVWMVTQSEPARVEVLPLINRGQPKLHDLPEPIAHVSGHPKSDLLACLGRSGRVYIVDLDGRTRLRVLSFPNLERVDAVALVTGRAGVAAFQRGRGFAFEPLDGRESSSVFTSTSTAAAAPRDEEHVRSAPALDEPATDAEPRPSSLYDDDAPAQAPEAPRPPPRTRLESPFADSARTERSSARPVFSSMSGSPPQPTATEALSGTAEIHAAPAPSAAAAKPARNLAARFAAVRDRRDAALAPAPLVADVAPVTANASGAVAPTIGAAPVRATAITETAGPSDLGGRQMTSLGPPHVPAVPQREHADVVPTVTASTSWRDACVAWTREQLDGPPPVEMPRGLPGSELLECVAGRFALPLAVYPAFVLLYGAHLLGHDGLAPATLAAFLDRGASVGGGWTEALGRGDLAATGVATYERSRVRIASAVQRCLDELPPETGRLVGEPADLPLLGACVVVGDGSLVEVARAYAARAGGAILAAYSERSRAEVAFEAHVRGATAMLHAHAFDGTLDAPAIYVARDEEIAAMLGLPRLA